jgi:hypothetical protein
MCGKPLESPDSPRCRFTFADGRRCRMPAHPSYDGLCYPHGTLAERASRQDNLVRELAPLASGSSNSAKFHRACRTLFRAIAQRRIPPERAAVLVRISKLIRQAHRAKQDDAFLSGHGPAWDEIRQLLDSRTHPTSDS